MLFAASAQPFRYKRLAKRTIRSYVSWLAPNRTVVLIDQMLLQWPPYGITITLPSARPPQLLPTISIFVRATIIASNAIVLVSPPFVWIMPNASTAIVPLLLTGLAFFLACVSSVRRIALVPSVDIGIDSIVYPDSREFVSIAALLSKWSIGTLGRSRSTIAGHKSRVIVTHQAAVRSSADKRNGANTCGKCGNANGNNRRERCPLRWSCCCWCLCHIFTLPKWRRSPS